MSEKLMYESVHEYLYICFVALKKLKKLNLSCCRQLTNKLVPMLNGKCIRAKIYR